MIRVTRTRNARLIEKILHSDPQLMQAVGADYDTPIPDPATNYYLICRHEQHGLLGLGTFTEVVNGEAEAHACFLSKHWGTDHRCDEAGRACVQWMFENTPAVRLYTTIPDDFPQVQRYAERIGMQLIALGDDHKEYEIRKHE